MKKFKTGVDLGKGKDKTVLSIFEIKNLAADLCALEFIPCLGRAEILANPCYLVGIS